MMQILFGAFYILLSLVSAHAAPINSMPCEVIQSNTDRLNCYDNIAAVKKDKFISFQPFVVNMVDGNTVKIEFVLYQLDPEVMPITITNRQPAIRNRLIGKISKLSARELITDKGKIKLAHQISDVFCNEFGRPVGCVEVLFSELVWISN